MTGNAHADQPLVTIVGHPLVQDRLTRARDHRTGVQEFRRLLGRIAGLMTLELTRNLPTEPCDLDTPLGPCRGSVLACELTVVPILRAGLPLAEGILHLLPAARVGHLGIYRDAETLKPVVYYNRLPPDIADTKVIVVDPVLATGGSLSEAAEIVKQAGAADISALCLVACPEGIQALHDRHPGLLVYTAAVDQGLDKRGFVVPGLGDVGARLFGIA